MHRTPHPASVAVWLAAGIALAAIAGGCTPSPSPPLAVRWQIARPEPAFDPDGPPHPVRQSLERALTRGLLTFDSSGVAPDAAESWTWSGDRLALTFRLRPGLRFSDGSPCGSRDFARALAGGLGRSDHATRGWELAAVRGVDAVRAGRPLPALGIETPDSSTLVLRLARRDPGLPERLARGSVGHAWKDRRAVSWKEAVGLGPMRVLQASEGRWTLTPVNSRERTALDTLAIRFATGEGRTRAALRAGAVDLVWPLPPDLVDEPLPRGYRAARLRGGRQLLLVMRADLPPANRLATRRALAHGINRNDLLRALGSSASPPAPLLPGASPFAAPGFDLQQMRQWMEQGKLGRSFHVSMAYDADGPGARIARVLQEEWSRADVYVELMPRRGSAWPTEALRGTRSHLLLAELEETSGGLAGALAPLIAPARGPAVGSFRTAWRTREFDGVLAGETRGGVPNAAAIEARFEQELVVLPLAELSTEWVEREIPAAWTFGTGPGPSFGRIRGRSNPGNR